MFRSILVPLDSSAFSEQALPLAVNIACRAGSALNLVQVHMLYAPQEAACAWLPFDPAADAALREQEKAYLLAVARRVGDARTSVATALASGLDADGILGQAQACRANLIVMTTHGLGPVSRFFLGSVADEIVRRSAVPVLLLRPHDPPAEPAVASVPSNVLIPLDGSKLAEEVLPAAAELARLLGVRCTLLAVIEAHPHPSSERNAQDLQLETHLAEARSYLRRIAERLHEQTSGADTRVVVAPHAAGAILQAAEPGVLIALATHGRGGLRRMLLGSVADKVIRGATGPVLVCRPATR
jgi:nucleotide-binding universal stress UspA family protein